MTEQTKPMSEQEANAQVSKLCELLEDLRSKGLDDQLDASLVARLRKALRLAREPQPPAAPEAATPPAREAEAKELYELMQQYRAAPMHDQRYVLECYEAVIGWIKSYNNTHAAKAVEEHESKLAQIADCINTELRALGLDNHEIQRYLTEDFRPAILSFRIDEGEKSQTCHLGKPTPCIFRL